MRSRTVTPMRNSFSQFGQPHAVEQLDVFTDCVRYALAFSPLVMCPS